MLASSRRTGSRLSRRGRLDPPPCVDVSEVICWEALLAAGVGFSSPEPAAGVVPAWEGRGGDEVRRRLGWLEAFAARTEAGPVSVLLLRRVRPTMAV